MQIVDSNPAGGLRLDHHHAHAVGHDIVELARDPVALLGSGMPGALLLLALEPLRIGLKLSSQSGA